MKYKEGDIVEYLDGRWLRCKIKGIDTAQNLLLQCIEEGHAFEGWTKTVGTPTDRLRPTYHRLLE